jgi:hypothetical protein
MFSSPTLSRLSMHRQRLSWAHMRAGLALFIYAWVLFQHFGGLTEMAFQYAEAEAQATHEHDHAPMAMPSEAPAEAATLMAQTAITSATRQCVHHRVACPPQCHCPPLKPETESSSQAGAAVDAAESQEGDVRADLLPGDAAFETCHGMPMQDMAWGFIPVHLGSDRVLLTLCLAGMAFPGHQGLRFQSIDRLAPEKVPIA